MTTTHKIKAIRFKELPSKFGGTWKIAELKIEGDDRIHELKGFGSKALENLKVGDSVVGYVSEKVWDGPNGRIVTPTINKITAEYVYELLMNHIDQNTTLNPLVPVAQFTADDGWDTGAEDSNQPAF
jgi:hypothetical protein